MADYIVHKPVALKDVQAKFKKGIESVSDLADTYFFQRKYDGVSGVLYVAPNEVKTMTRVGTVLKSLHHVERFITNRLNTKLSQGQGFVLLGEVWKNGTVQTRINGLTMRDAASPELKFVAFDIIPLNDFIKGECHIPFVDRYKTLNILLRDLHETDPVKLCETYNPGTYGDPQTFCGELVALGGYDGGILRSPVGMWRRGGGSTGEIIKVKDAATISVDLRVIGTTKGAGKYVGMVGGLQCLYRDGKKVTVSGMTDAQRLEWAEHPERIIGQIVEVHALGETSTGLLREPRMKSIRHDKVKADYERE